MLIRKITVIYTLNLKDNILHLALDSSIKFHFERHKAEIAQIF